VAARVAQTPADAFDLAHREAAPDQIVQADATRHDVAARLAGAELDAVHAGKRLDRLRLDQRDVLARLALVEEGAAAGEIAVPLEALAGDRPDLPDRKRLALGVGRDVDALD